MRCFECQREGHIARDCPDRDALTAGCGTCDPRTHLIDLGDKARRCECHPNHREPLKQFRTCPACHATIHQWDNNPCGSHSMRDTEDRRPGRQHIDRIISGAA
jgi:hypothetical protein